MRRRWKRRSSRMITDWTIGTKMLRAVSLWVICFATGLFGSVLLVSHLENAGSFRTPLDPGSPGDSASYAGELVLVFVGTPECPASRDRAIRNLLPRVHERLQATADRHHLRLRTVGVAPTQHAREGATYLDSILDFQQLVVGGGELNTGLMQYVTQHLRGMAATPQFVVVLVTSGSPGAEARSAEVLARKLGVPMLATWLEAGAPLALGAQLKDRNLPPSTE
jgi:hypothetical protein